MISVIRNTAISILAIVLLFPTLLWAQTDSLNVRIAVMPAADYTENPEIAGTLSALLEQLLQDKGYETVSDSELRSALRRHRIRHTFDTAPEDLGVLADALNADYLLNSSLDAYAEEEAGAKLSLSLRLLELPHGDIVWARTIAKHSRDNNVRLPGNFNDDLNSLLRQQLYAMISDLSLEPYTLKRVAGQSDVGTSSTSPGNDAIAVLLPANESKQRHAEYVLSNQLLSELVRRGYEVVYPGRIRAAMLSEGNLSRGETTRELMSALHNSAGARWILTGTLREYRGWSIADENSDCAVAFDLRLIDTTTGLVAWITSDSALGSEQAGLFGIGYVHGASVLCNKLVKRLAGRIPHRRIKSLPHDMAAE